MGNHHKARHHRGAHQTNAGLVTRAAQTNPAAICWRHGCHVTQCPRHRDGTPSTWIAGHTIDGAIDPPPWLDVTRPPPKLQAWLAPECSAGNASHGATHGNRKRQARFTWP